VRRRAAAVSCVEQPGILGEVLAPAMGTGHLWASVVPVPSASASRGRGKRRKGIDGLRKRKYFGCFCDFTSGD